MGKKSKKEQIIMMQRELEKLKAQKAAEELRTREGVAAGITMPAITKLSEYPNRDLKKIGKYLSAYVDESIKQFMQPLLLRSKSCWNASSFHTISGSVHAVRGIYQRF